MNLPVDWLDAVVGFVRTILILVLQIAVVPGSMLLILYGNGRWAYADERNRETGISIEQMYSARYGFWTGLFLFFIVMTVKLSTPLLDFSEEARDSIVVVTLAVVVGFAFGFLGLLAISRLSRFNLLGFVVAFSVTGSSTSLLFYILNDEIAVNLSIASFAFLAGVFSYAMISKTARGLLPFDRIKRR